MVRILLADDDAATRDLFSRALSSDGHQIVVTQDGQEAIDHLLADPASVDLLISDVEMPGLDGIALAERALAAAPGLRVLLISGFEGGLDRAGKLPGARVRKVSKPLTLEQIRAEVRGLLR
jgi:two-component system, cell cycle response regulator CpdR